MSLPGDRVICLLTTLLGSRFGYNIHTPLHRHKAVSYTHLALHPTRPQTLLFSFLIGILHGVGEVLIILPFSFGGSMAAYEAKGFFVSVILLVGVGTVVHSMVDYGIASVIWSPLRQVIRPSALCDTCLLYTSRCV